MPIIALVPEVEKPGNWWEKTIYCDYLEAENDWKVNGCDYVFNVSLNHYLNASISSDDVLKALKDKGLISKEILEKYKTCAIVFTEHGTYRNLELKLGESPLVLKMNCHLKPIPELEPKPDPNPDSIPKYISPHLRKPTEIPNVERLMELIPIKNFLISMDKVIKELEIGWKLKIVINSDTKFQKDVNLIYMKA